MIHGNVTYDCTGFYRARYIYEWLGLRQRGVAPIPYIVVFLQRLTGPATQILEEADYFVADAARRNSQKPEGH